MAFSAGYEAGAVEEIYSCILAGISAATCKKAGTRIS
jgi:hypothetical protein